MHVALLVLQIVVSLSLITTVLLQSGKSAGLSGTIAGGAETFFGKSKGIDALLNKITTVLAVAFLGITVLLSLI